MSIKSLFCYILVTVFFFFLAVPVCAKTVYFTKIGFTTYYKVGGWPTVDDSVGSMEEAIAHSGVNGVLVIDGGASGITYIDADLDDSDNSMRWTSNNQVIAGSTEPGHDGKVTLVSTTGTVLYNSSKTGVWAKNITISGGVSPLADTYGIMGEVNSEDVTIENVGTGLYTFAANNTHTRLVVKNCLTYGVLGYTGSAIFNYSSIRDCPILVRAYSSDLDFNNCDFFGSREEAVFTYGNNVTGPSVSLVNCRISANATGLGASDHVLSHTATNGDITITDCQILYSPYAPQILGVNNVTDGGGNIYAPPDVISEKRQTSAAIAFCIDDTMNLGVFSDLSTLLEGYGWHGTMALIPSVVTPEEWETVNDLVSRGHEMACHGYYTFNAFNDTQGISISYTGGDATQATVSILDTDSDGYADRLRTFVNGGGGPDLDIDLSNYNTLSKLAKYIDELENYTCTNDNIDTSGGQSMYLADIASENIKEVVADLDYNPSRKWAMEIDHSKSEIESHIPGYVCRSFVCPGNSTSEEVRRAIADAGFEGSRGGQLGFKNNYKLESINVYNIAGFGLHGRFGTASPSETNIKLYINSLLEVLKHEGGVAVIYSHDLDETTMATWKSVLSEVYNSGVAVKTLGELIAYAKTYDPSGDLESSDKVIYTRTMVDSCNYGLKGSSLCIGAGDVIADVHEQTTPAYGLNGVFEHFIDDGIDVGAYPVNDQSRAFTAITYDPFGYEVRGTADSPAQITLPSGMSNIDISGLSLNEPINFFLSGPVADGASVLLQSNHKLFTEWIPVPTNQSAWNYASIENPIKETNPADCQPFAVGDLSFGNLSLQVGLPTFSSGVDVYLAIGFADALFLVDGSNVLHSSTEVTALPRWKTNVSAAIDESLYGDIQISLLPVGVYNLYTLVVPAGETDFSHYYFWATSFNVGD